MSVRKQIPSLCKLYWFYEEIPEELLDETDADRLIVFLPQVFWHFPVPASKSASYRGSNKKSFAIKLFQFCDLKTQQRYIFQEVLNICEGELTCLVNKLSGFVKTFDQASKCL